MRETALAGQAEGGLARVLDLARRHLGMELALFSEFCDGRQVYRGLDGDAASFGCELGSGPPLADTYCRLMVAGDIPNAIGDSLADPQVRDLPTTRNAGIRSYVGVPVRSADGTLYGSLCCVSHDAQPVDERDVRFLSLLSDLLCEHVEMERERAEDRRGIGRLLDEQAVGIALQPIVAVRDGRLLGVEALSRFPGGYGAPDEVFATAHRIGLGLELERLAVLEAVERLPLLAPHQYLAVNLTPAVALAFAAGVETHPEIPYHRLVLEITEHAAVDGYAELRNGLEPARRRGLRLAIDDAGAGYASLHHVVELAPDIIKIDRALVDGVARDNARRSVMTALVALARDIGATVVAEGVEQAADAHTIGRLGVDAAQGYLFAAPSTDRRDVARWVSHGTAVPRTDVASVRSAAVAAV